MKQLLTVIVIMLVCTCTVPVYALDTYNSVELYRSYNKQQIRTRDTKGNRIVVTPHYQSYNMRNDNVSEKIVAIYDKHAPEGAYGYRYVLYRPIGKYVGHHKVMQPSPNGYGWVGIPDGDTTGLTSKTPCFKTIQEAKHYYYPQWY